ncbi:MAG TPA: type IVB secretion system protein IcmH/DotU [Pyrinomonadaceae bacterium]|nr:type IVB secretion system protein IcmH/DotU [Pyrinomonadaceae bacterium]
MQELEAENISSAKSRRPRSGSDLISLAAPTFELVLKLQAGIIKPSNELRQLVHRLLEEMEKRGATLRYSERQIKAVKFALAAFVDETLLSNAFPLRDEWEKFPLQLQYFDEHLAGDTYFTRLEALLRHVEAEADVVEVYYLCLLLGFKGRYVVEKAQLAEIIRNTANHLRRVGRLSENELSPHWLATDQPEPRIDPGVPIWAKIGAAACLALVLFFYLVLHLLLSNDLKVARDQLLR